ncbi:hypothetical protein ACLOJK_005974 [Asimina triloba]
MTATIHEESYEDFRMEHICINEFMFKARVRLPFEFDIFETLNAFNVYSGGEQAFRSVKDLKPMYFYARLVETEGATCPD